jgi:hypothetical protein
MVGDYSALSGNSGWLRKPQACLHFEFVCFRAPSELLRLAPVVLKFDFSASL